MMRCSPWPYTRDKRLDWQDQNWGLKGGGGLFQKKQAAGRNSNKMKRLSLSVQLKYTLMNRSLLNFRGLFCSDQQREEGQIV